MVSITIGVFSENLERRTQIASALAKKSTPEDITIYQTVFSGKILSVIEPTKYPERVASMIYAAYLSDYCIIDAENLSAPLGEIIVTLDLLSKKYGCIITNLDLKPLIRGTSLENFTIFSTFDEAKDQILAFSPQIDSQLGAFASIDHSFEVKGVGSILLGFVHSGKISIHDKLKVYPSGKELEVRSIQMHDADVKETNTGDRFGLAIKLLTSKDVERGDFLASTGVDIKVSKDPDTKISAAKFLKEPLKNGEQIHAFQFLADGPCKWNGLDVQAGKTELGKLMFEKNYAINPKFPALIVRLDAKGLRIIGKAAF